MEPDDEVDKASMGPNSGGHIERRGVRGLNEGSDKRRMGGGPDRGGECGVRDWEGQMEGQTNEEAIHTEQH